MTVGLLYVLGKFNNWLLQEARPNLTKPCCMQYKRNSVTNYGCLPESCDSHRPKLCVTDNQGW